MQSHGGHHTNPIDDGRPVVGIDPGLRRTGFAVILPQDRGAGGRLLDAGLISVSPSLPLARRLLEIEHGLTEIIEQHAPSTLICEQLYAHYKHPRTAVRMAHARGVILAAAARAGLAILSIDATRAKKLLTGNGHAGKTQMQRAVATTLALHAIPEPHDVADAMAIALCGIHMLRGGFESMRSARGQT